VHVSNRLAAHAVTLWPLVVIEPPSSRARA
jgi:hypothetical protein